MKRSIVPVKLIRCNDESLVSRAQAKELISLFRSSEEIVLDFNDINTIGSDFADEIYRVFSESHPSIILKSLDTSEEVERMIQRIRSNEYQL